MVQIFQCLTDAKATIFVVSHLRFRISRIVSYFVFVCFTSQALFYCCVLMFRVCVNQHNKFIANINKKVGQEISGN